MDDLVKILAGLQDTPDGRAALDRAVEEARARDAELHLAVYVTVASEGDTTREYERQRAAAQRNAEREADAIRARGIDVTVHVPVGATKPSQAVLRVARQEGVDLLVIGMRRRSRVGKLVTGSNAQDILLHAPAPVLAVKASYDADDELEV